ncbi:unnamed protein product [Phytophthora fragariaefolia]|uniref:Unnamed protein product n=1 Tax=Phytophthora fragariaefolia TaxID=1490495 RepID=A0A9W6XX11_9STRA|nr:unnamed protein product [Phytophthora fragariaefolia]
MGVMACRKETLQLKLTQRKEPTAQLKSTRYLHVVRAFNAAANSLATEALGSQVTKVVLSESRKAELMALNKIPVLYVEKQTLAETDLPAQRMQPTPQTEPHAVAQTTEEPQVTAADNEVDDLPADPESPISPQGGTQRSVREGTGNLETTLDEPVRADPMAASQREDLQQQSRQNESGEYGLPKMKNGGGRIENIRQETMFNVISLWLSIPFVSSIFFGIWIFSGLLCSKHIRFFDVTRLLYT